MIVHTDNLGYGPSVRFTRRLVMPLAVVVCVGLIPTIAGAGPSAGGASDPVFDWWAPAPVEPPANLNVTLADVDALGSADAWAVGTREVAANDFASFVMRWTGGAWEPVGSGSLNAEELSAVSARASDDVFVGGSIDDAQAVFAHFDGSSWTDLPTPAGVSGLDQLEAVGASETWATAPHGDNELIYRWDGTSWSEVALPSFPDQDLIFIADIEARTATDVWVTGTYHDSVAQANRPIAIRWDGSVWTDLVPPTDLSIVAELTVVGASDAYAESSELVGGEPVTAIQHWNGSSWSPMTLPLTGDVDVRGMASTSSGDIWAIGDVVEANRRSFIAHSDGTSWEAWQPSPATSSLDGLSFASGSAGFAVGAIGDRPGKEVSSFVFGSKIVASTTPEQVAFGQPTTVQGTLLYKDGQVASGVTIHAERVDRDDVVTPLSDVTTGPDGAFSFADTPSTVGAQTYRFVAEPDGEHPGGVGSAAVEIDRRLTSITIGANPKSINYDRTTKVTARLSAFEQGSVIEIWALKPGGGRTLQRRHAVDDHGAVSVTVKPKANTTYVAESLRDDTFEAAETVKPVTVGVRPLVEASMVGSYATADGYRLYHYAARCPTSGARCPRFQGRVWPKHTRCFVVRFQQQTRTGWNTIHDGCYLPDDTSQVALIVVYGDRRVIGQRFRMRTEFEGDDDHEPAVSPWAYFRVTD